VATERLSGEMRVIGRESLPAVRLEVMLLEAVSALRRLEARYGLLRDAAYLDLFRERVRTMEVDLLRLTALLSTSVEREALAEARARLGDYRTSVERHEAAGEPPPAQRLEAALERLYVSSETELRRREESAQRLNERSRQVAVGGLVLATLVGLVLSLFAALRIARPLRRLEAATRDVAQRAFSAPIPVRGRDEVAELTRAFNQMAAQLRDMDKLKDEFFSAISHDLRTPLAAISWSAEVLKRGTSGALTSRQERLIDGIMLSSGRLLGLVNQILELGRLRAGKLRLDVGPTDLSQLVAKSVAEVQSLAEQGDLTIEVRIPDGLGELQADGARVQQVLVNLLGNAIKFTPPGGRISVSAEEVEEAVVVRVVDTGMGIAPDRLGRIFERYEQGHAGAAGSGAASPAGAAGIEGSGIGLAVVRGIVEAHGGQVWAESREGHGSMFAFRLPRMAVVA
jgi:signal transduction histidine kinase